MKNIKIEIPAGFEIDNFDIKTGEIKFKEVKKEITKRIKTFADVCKEDNTTEEEFKKKYSTLDENTYSFLQCKLISKVFNQGWEGDWDNSNEYKYFVYFDMRDKGSFFDCGCWDSESYVSAALQFKTRKLATYCGKQFEDIYRVYFKG